MSHSFKGRAYQPQAAVTTLRRASMTKLICVLMKAAKRRSLGGSAAPPSAFSPPPARPLPAPATGWCTAKEKASGCRAARQAKGC